MLFRRFVWYTPDVIFCTSHLFFYFDVIFYQFWFLCDGSISSCRLYSLQILFFLCMKYCERFNIFVSLLVWMSIVYYGDSLWIGLTIMSTSTMMLRTRMWCKHIEVATIIRKVILHNEIESRIEQTALALGASLYLSLSLSLTHTHICFFTLALPKHCTSSEKGCEAQFATSTNTIFFFGG